MFVPMDPVIPFDFEVGDPQAMVQAMIRMRETYGLRRFLITGVGIGVRITGYSDDAVYRRLAEAIRSAKERTQAHDIEIGWWCAPTLKAGNSPYQHLVDISGRSSPISTCPLDERFVADLSRQVALVAEIARPYMIQFEDDYQLSNHPGFRLGCLCPLHLAELARRTGRTYTREELEAAFDAEPMRETALRRQFAAVSRDSLTALAARLRAAVDRVAPETRMCLCEPGGTDLDGGLSEPVTRALAGPHTRPAIRIFGSQYSSLDSTQQLPAIMAHTMYSAEHLPEDFELYHETDTYPHTRFYASAAFIRVMLYGAMAIGCDDTLLYATQYLDNPLEDVGYAEMYRAEAPKLGAFKQAIAGSALEGWQTLYRPDGTWALPVRERWAPRDTLASLASLFGRMGMPYTTRERAVTCLAGFNVAAMTDDELLAILRSSVLLDATAARQVSDRGLGDWLGVATETLPELAMSEERILPAAGVDDRWGRKIYNMAFAPAGAELARYSRLVPQGAEVLTTYCDPTGRVLQPGLTRFVNREGGRVAVMGSSLMGNNSSNLFSYRKKEVLRHLYTWLNHGQPLPVAALQAPNVWLLFREAADGAVVMLCNLTSDPWQEPVLAVAPPWQRGTIEELTPSGTWQALAVVWQMDTVRLPGACLPKEPRILRMRRA